jgi:hypothetical protein
MEGSEGVSALSATSNDFLSFLDEQFEANRPYEAAPLVDVPDDDYETTTPYWHEVIRDHHTSKPSLPKTASLNLPRVKTSTKSRRNGTSSSDPVRGESSGILKCKIKKNKSRADRCNRLLGTEDLSTVLRQGWTIAKGWDNRPKVSQINPQAVQDDINRMRARYERARTPAAQGGTKEGSSCMSHTGSRLLPEAWPTSNPMVIVPKREKSPGPKYNLQPNLEEHGIPRQLDYFTVKDISFAKSERFAEAKPSSPGILSYSPQPLYNPSRSASLNNIVPVLRPISPALQLNYNPISFNNSSRAGGFSPNGSTGGGLGPTSRPGSRAAALSPSSSWQGDPGSPERSLSRPGSQGQGLSTRVSTSGREFLGSIYYDGYNAPSPGAMYDSNAASRHTSTQMPVPNAIFAPTNRGTRTDLRQQAAELRLDPVKNLRVRQGALSVPGNAASKEQALRRKREKAKQKAREQKDEYDAVLKYMQEN